MPFWADYTTTILDRRHDVRNKSPLRGFTPLDGEAREVSADKTRFQAGLGYVFGPELRLELQYIHMRTLNTAAHKYEASSNVVWLAVKHFL